MTMEGKEFETNLALVKYNETEQDTLRRTASTAVHAGAASLLYYSTKGWNSLEDVCMYFSSAFACSLVVRARTAKAKLSRLPGMLAVTTWCMYPDASPKTSVAGGGAL